MKLAIFFPSTAISHFLLLCRILFFFSPNFINPFASAAETPPACSGSTQGMQIVRTYGQCSPLGQEKSHANSVQILLQDELRVRSLNTVVSRKLGKYVVDAHQGSWNQPVPVPGKDRLPVGGGNYVVKVGFGTPSREFNLILDTGSYQTWIKCKGCFRGCEGKNTTYDPKASSTYSKPYCNGSNCTGHIGYFDRTSVTGDWASDTLTISSSYLLSEFQFICANEIKSTDSSNKADGLLALGQGDKSLLSHTTPKVFCYCLPHEDSTGYVVLGSQARETCQVRSLNFTQLVVDKGQYFVNLVGISIGNKTMNISDTTSSSRRVMIDSGTVITRLPKQVYKDFSFTFRKFMEKYDLVHKPQKEIILDTCYKLEKYKYNTLKLPAVVLRFENLDVILDKSQVLWDEEEGNVFCLAFAAKKNDEDVIIGNHQQQKLNVLFDIQNGKMGIGAGNCG